MKNERMAQFSNSSEDVLSEQCADCPLGFGWNNPNQHTLFDAERIPKPCPVAFIQLTYNYDQMKDGNKQLKEAVTYLVDDAGVCQVRELLLEARQEMAP